ncbi:hypothetical protein FisN_1Hh667 [Fistulifera solaris]|uniref:Transcription factor 25 n=1 Tax=Fistulifera solaris TaxID=1519565 RepID=A0A1Z5JMI8_FISSO|nr:hypothetical protein FisN_1Hh667 [Fistulifera solaris]|eukprot:GAX15230.1 hypothetical protein FisN_1Hh667 [Fistulifera solaris]
MSARAIRALRGGSHEAHLAENADADDDSSSEEYDEKPRSRPSAFSAMLDTDDEEDDSDTGEEDTGSEDGNTDVPKGGSERNNDALMNRKTKQSATSQSAHNTKNDDKEGQKDDTESEEEDLDTLLNEFTQHDIQQNEETKQHKSSFFSQICGVQKRFILDLDVDAAMRNALLNGDLSHTRGTSNQKSRQVLLFGPPRDNWPRPLHFVGGGIGMVTYEQSPRPIPWPYSDIATLVRNDNKKDLIEFVQDMNHWFTFQHAQDCSRDLEDYAVVKQTGDLNALVMFAAHHPYVTDALLQLTGVLYQTNHSQEGLALLRRCLWVYESSAMLPFNNRVLDGAALMDMDQPENATFFRSLFKLIQVSTVAALPRTAAAVCRYILALDPLRDPMHVLAVLDAFTINCKSDTFDQWLIDLVDNNCISIYFRDEENPKRVFQCTLGEMPNWLLSYSLAQYRLHGKEGSFDGLRKLLTQFPEIVSLLLQELEVDITGRSFLRDWPTALEKATERSFSTRRSWGRQQGELDPHEVQRTVQTADKILALYVRLTAKVWGGDDILQFLYDTLVTLPESESPALPPAAIMRYSALNPGDFHNRVELLPQDMNIMDGGMIAHAMTVVTNRPRFLRHMPRGAMHGQQRMDIENLPAGFPALFGPPTNVVDPDWPLVEVLWRSFLPWNHVEGVRPPAR